MPWKPKISKKLHFWPFFIVCSHFALLSALIITKMRSVEQYAHDRFFFAHTEIKESKRSSLFSQTRCYSLTRGRFLRETACNPVCRRIWRNPEWNPENLSGYGDVTYIDQKDQLGPIPGHFTCWTCSVLTWIKNLCLFTTQFPISISNFP